MDDREFEQMLRRLMKTDFSAGNEAFRDALLERCLGMLNADERGISIDDADLELLAAAGDPFETPHISGDLETRDRFRS